MRLIRAVSTCLMVVPCLAAFSGARGQSAAPHGPRRFGLVGGMNSATFGGKDATNPTPDNRTGFLGGVMLAMPMGSTFWFQPELLFSMKGAMFKDPAGNATFKMNYIELPLLARYDIPASGGVKPFLLAGPSIGFRESCDLVIDGPSGGTATCDALVGSGGQKFETVDYTALIGGGLAFDVGGRTLTIGARYDYSLSKIQKDSDVKHRVLSVLTTFEFPMMGK